MAITSASNKISFIGDGSQTRFDFTFPIANASDLKVIITDFDGNNTVLTKDYIVDTENSRVIYPGYIKGQAPPAILIPPILRPGYKLTIIRETPLTQEVNLGARHPLPAIEGMSDKLTMIMQDIKEQVDRSIKVEVGSSGGDLNTFKEYADSAIKSADKANISAEAALESELKAAASAQQAYSSASSINAMAASIWSSGESYSYPDLVTFSDGNTYRCIGADIVGEEPANSPNWVRVTFAGSEAENLDNLVSLNKNVVRNGFYNTGDIAYSPHIPSWAYLEVVSPGVTADYFEVADYPKKENDIFIDGSVTFRLRRIPQNDTIVKPTEPANAPKNSIWLDTTEQALKIKESDVYDSYSYFFPKTHSGQILDIDKYAKLDGATFTVSPKAPSVNNPGTIDNIATIADIANNLSEYATLHSPEFTGIPTAPNISNFKDNSTKVANTNFVQKVINDALTNGIFQVEHLVQNGYVQFHNGLLIQWGSFTSDRETKFNIKFPTECFTVVATCNDSSERWGYDWWNRWVMTVAPTCVPLSIKDMDAEGFTGYYAAITGLVNANDGYGGYNLTSSMGAAKDINWIAIGR